MVRRLYNLHVSSGHSLPSPFTGTFNASANDQLCGYQILGAAWLIYDEQFRRRAVNDLTINWGQVDLKVWIVTFLGLAKPHCIVCSSPYHSHSDCPSADPPRQQSRTGSLCFRFNRTSGCASSSCQFPYACRRCHSSSHSILRCPKSNTRKGPEQPPVSELKRWRTQQEIA